ncbi:Fut1_Fut2_like domain containing protein [Candidatus Nanopelagicaceae bacterium]
MRTKFLKANVQGGVGNQLFCYFAGFFTASRLSKELEVNTSLVGISGANHGYTIDGFGLPGKFSGVTRKIRCFRNFSLRVDNGLARRSRYYRFFRLSIMKTYTSTEIGYDINLDKITNLNAITGYFQTYKYFQQISNLQSFQLWPSNPSTWFINSIKMIENQSPYALHIRRGDYLLEDKFGILGTGYYLNAIAVLDEVKGKNPIAVFSDDYEAARRVLSPLNQDRLIFMESSRPEHPLETIVLMSKCSAVVIANSTFSWWGAILNKSEKATVICPSKWFKEMSDPIDLIPSHWIKVESVWG